MATLPSYVSFGVADTPAGRRFVLNLDGSIFELPFTDAYVIAIRMAESIFSVVLAERGESSADNAQGDKPPDPARIPPGRQEVKR